MKKGICVVLLGIVLLLLIPLSGHAGGTRFFVSTHIGVGYPGWWGHRFYWRGPVVVGWPYLGWPYVGWRYAGWSYYDYGPPPVVTQGPPVYSESEQEQPYYWYYCQNPQGYYPYIQSCPGGWMKVVPNVTPPKQ